MSTTKTIKRSALKRVSPALPLKDMSETNTNHVYLVSMPSRKYPTARGAASNVFRRVSTKRALSEQFHAAKSSSVWITSNSSSLASLVKEPPNVRGDRRLLVLDEMEEVTQLFLSAYFRYVVTASESLRLLEFEELAEVLSSPNRNERFIGGAYDRVGDAVLLYRGNVQPLVVPRAWFANRSSGAIVDVNKLKVIDYGQTVRLGEFEASVDAILYEFDSDYRRSAKKRALVKDTSLGAAIRRLRLQKGLSRGDFPGVTTKAIARIERNEISKPHIKTLMTIASVLGVSVESLKTF